jgi:hypothetical protein
MHGRRFRHFVALSRHLHLPLISDKTTEPQRCLMTGSMSPSVFRNKVQGGSNAMLRGASDPDPWTDGWRSLRPSRSDLPGACRAIPTYVLVLNLNLLDDRHEPGAHDFLASYLNCTGSRSFRWQVGRGSAAQLRRGWGVSLHTVHSPIGRGSDESGSRSPNGCHRGTMSGVDGAERSRAGVAAWGAWGDTATARRIGGSDGQVRCVVAGLAPKR